MEGSENEGGERGAAVDREGWVGGRRCAGRLSGRREGGRGGEGVGRHGEGSRVGGGVGKEGTREERKEEEEACAQGREGETRERGGGSTFQVAVYLPP